MRGRIEQLGAEVRHARAQQADTRASIGKIMAFLSHVYRDRGSNMPSVALQPLPEPTAGRGCSAT